MSQDSSLCSACGFANEARARFCGGCARPLARLAGGFAPAQYTPPHLAERIRAARAAMEGERKLVTVMFVDVLGSLELIAGRDPEQAQTILDSLLQTMIGAVHRYEGTVNQVLGDGIMAIFGAPIAHEDHAVRAACAALAIQDAVRTSSDGAWRALGVQAQVRIGINSGVVIITAISNDLGVDYRAVGTTTHLASRMEQIALPGTIRVTRDTLRLAEGLVDAEPLGRITVKGIAEEIEVYELQRMTPGGAAFRARVSRGLTPLLGRTDELELLVKGLRRALSGEVQAVALRGEPGVGKSRLCYELTRLDMARHCRLLECNAISYEQATPHAAVITLLRRCFGIAEAEGAEQLRARLKRDLPALSPGLQAALPIVLGLLDVAGDDETWRNLDPAQRKRRAFDAARSIIARLCERQPLILLWENIHWQDAESHEFIEGLLRDPPGRSLLMLITTREALPAWEQARVTRRHLLPLPPQQADEMLRRLLGTAPELASLRAVLIERTYGNPFFIEEIVRSLVESRVLVGEAGRYELRETGPRYEIPPTAEAVIAARIDALAPEVKALVQTAAVIGTEMTVDLLQRVSGLADERFHALFRAVQESEAMYQVQFFPSTLCGFRHALVQEVAYSGVLHARRKALHCRVMEVLEAQPGDRQAEQIERLAVHSFRGELWEKAVRYHIMAAARAVTHFANHEAVSILDRGLRAVEHLEAGKARSEAAIDLRLASLAALLPLGEQERTVGMLLEAEAVATTLGDPRRLGAIHSQLSTALWMLGQHERAREYAERSLATAQAHRHLPLQLGARFSLAMAHHALGDYARCIELTQGLLVELTSDFERRRLGWAGYPSILCRNFLGSALTFTGEFDEAAECLEQGRVTAQAVGQPYSTTLIHHELGFLHLRRGQPERAVAILEAGMEVAREGEVRTMYGPLAGWLGAALAEQGRTQEAVDTIKRAVDGGAMRFAGHYAHFYTLNGLACAHLHAGRHDEALAHAKESADRTLAAREMGHHGYALCRLAEVRAALGRAHRLEAKAFYGQALDLAEARGMRPLAADCRAGLARLA